MNILKTLAGSALLLLGSYALTATAHERGHHSEADTEEVSADVPVLAWDDPTFKVAEKLFRTAGGYGCVVCHGQFAQGGGNAGGNIRDHSLSQIDYALQNEATMQLLDKALSPDDKMLLAGYLKTLGQFRLVEWTIEGEPSYSKVSLEREVASQLVIFNKTFEPLELSLEAIRSGVNLSVEPYATESFKWTTQPGVIRLQYKQNILDIDIR